MAGAQPVPDITPAQCRAARGCAAHQAPAPALPRLKQPRSTAILGDEFDASSFKGPSDGRHHGGNGPALAGLEMDDGA
jgi:hypothetical protein